MPVIGKPSQQPATPLFSVGWWLGSFADNLDDLGNKIADVFIIGEWLAYPFRTLAWIVSIAEGKLYDADEYLADVWTWVNGLIEGYTFLNLLYWASGHFWAIRNQPVNWVKSQLGAIAWWFGWLMFDPKSFVNHFARELKWFVGLLLDNPKEFVNRFVRDLKWFVGLLLDNPAQFINHFIRDIAWHIGMLLDNPIGFVRTYLLAIQPLLGLLLNDPRRFVIEMIRQYKPDLADLIDNPAHWLKLKLLYILSFDWRFINDPIKYLFDRMIDRIRHLIEPHMNFIVQYVIDIVLRYM